MGEHQPPRPIGWWLKEADARIDAAFESALATTGLDRRRWQLLASLAGGPAARSDLAMALRRFDDAAAVDAILSDLTVRGLVVADDSGVIELTAEGRTVQAAAATQVAAVRTQVANALAPDGYGQLMELLARLVRGLSDASPSGDVDTSAV